MKPVFFLFALLFGSVAFSQDSKGTTTPTGRETRNPADAGKQITPTIVNPGGTTQQRSFKCCSRIYYAAPPAMTGGKTMTRTLTANPFKGKNRGIDLTFDFLDPKGAVVTGLSEAITTNGSGDIVIDGNKLPKGQKLRLRAKAGSSMETYTLN